MVQLFPSFIEVIRRPDETIKKQFITPLKRFAAVAPFFLPGGIPAKVGKFILRKPLQVAGGLIGGLITKGLLETSPKARKAVVTVAKEFDPGALGRGIGEAIEQDVELPTIGEGLKKAGIIGVGAVVGAALIPGVAKKAKDVLLPERKAPVMEALPVAELPATVTFDEIPGEIKPTAVTPLEKQLPTTFINQQINIESL